MLTFEVVLVELYLADPAKSLTQEKREGIWYRQEQVDDAVKSQLCAVLGDAADRLFCELYSVTTTLNAC